MITGTQQNPGEGHEDLRRKGHSSSQSDFHLDGYNGNRARMAFGEPILGNDRGIASVEDDHRLGALERIVLVLLAMFIIFAVIASMLILPFAFILYLLFRGPMLIFNAFKKSETNKRFFILGTEGSYTIKDVETREFVAKNIPTMRSAKRILRIFESEYPTKERT
jgi:hypothetical protein